MFKSFCLSQLSSTQVSDSYWIILKINNFSIAVTIKVNNNHSDSNKSAPSLFIGEVSKQTSFFLEVHCEGEHCLAFLAWNNLKHSPVTVTLNFQLLGQSTAASSKWRGRVVQRRTALTPKAVHCRKRLEKHISSSLLRVFLPFLHSLRSLGYTELAPGPHAVCAPKHPALTLSPLTPDNRASLSPV